MSITFNFIGLRLSQFVLTLASLLFAMACSTHPQHAQAPTEHSQIEIESTSSLPNAVFSCPSEEHRAITLSSKESKDTLRIQILGDDCNQALVKLTVSTSKGEVIHTSTAKALDYTYERKGAEGVLWMLNHLIDEQPISGAALPSYSYVKKNIHSLYYDIKESTFNRVKDKDLPIFCHRGGKSYSNCFVYLDSRVILLFEKGS